MIKIGLVSLGFMGMKDDAELPATDKLLPETFSGDDHDYGRE